jgi:ferric iron reductase protein FhuF
MSINNTEGYFINYKYDAATDRSSKDFVSIGRSAMFYGAEPMLIMGKYFPFSNETMKKS